MNTVKRTQLSPESYFNTFAHHWQIATIREAASPYFLPNRRYDQPPRRNLYMTLFLPNLGLFGIGQILDERCTLVKVCGFCVLIHPYRKLTALLGRLFFERRV